MGVLNIPRHEQDALKAVDTAVLDQLIEESLREERPTALRALRLESCGPYVASKLRTYETALAEHCKARAAKKRAETEDRVRRAGSDLAHAVWQMKARLELEEKEGQLFYIDDQIRAPYLFSKRLTVPVGYRWRRAIEDQWVFGTITFFHDVDSWIDYTQPLPKRKPSVAKQYQDRQDALYGEWEHLMQLALHSVKQYFREGGNGATIPQSFQAKADPYTRGLNNHSAQFWPV